MRGALGLSVAALLAAVGAAPLRAEACGNNGGGASSGGSSGGGGGGGGGRGLMSLLGAIGSIGSSGSSGGARPCSSGGGLRWTEADARAFNAFSRNLELSAGFVWQSIDLSTLPFRGWNSHPMLARQMGYVSEAPGSALGMQRGTLLGATVRTSVLFGEVFTLGLSGTIYGQVEENPAVAGAYGFFGARRAMGVEGGVEFGGLARIGVVSIRGGLYTGARDIWSDVTGLGFAGCDSVPVVHSFRFVIAPRLEASAALGSHTTIGVFVGVDALRPYDHHGGVMLSFHGGNFVRQAP